MHRVPTVQRTPTHIGDRHRGDRNVEPGGFEPRGPPGEAATPAARVRLNAMAAWANQAASAGYDPEGRGATGRP